MNKKITYSFYFYNFYNYKIKKISKSLLKFAQSYCIFLTKYCLFLFRNLSHFSINIWVSAFVIVFRYFARLSSASEWKQWLKSSQANFRLPKSERKSHEMESIWYRKGKDCSIFPLFYNFRFSPLICFDLIRFYNRFVCLSVSLFDLTMVRGKAEALMAFRYWTGKEKCRQRVATERSGLVSLLSLLFWP